MSSLEVKWKKLGDEFIYNVWYSRQKEGPWLKHNTVRLTDDFLSYYDSSLINTYTLDGLDVKEKYFIKVSCNDKYYLWWYSYAGIESIEGGLGSLFDRPTPDGGNTIGFNINITS